MSSNVRKISIVLNTELIIQPLKLVRVTAPRAPLSELSVCMRKCRVHKLQKTRTILSGSSEDADLMLEDELRALSTEKKEQLLHDAGILTYYRCKGLLLSPCLVSLDIG